MQDKPDIFFNCIYKLSLFYFRKDSAKELMHSLQQIQNRKILDFIDDKSDYAYKHNKHTCIEV